VIALGGITVERIPQVLAAGAYGVAMGREMLQADSPSEVVKDACFQIESQKHRKETRNATG
jgi:thiamine monophosphate synthase